GRERNDILQRLALGEIHMLIGTHAVFQEQVEFRDLALAVVDEQHRFGVHQRLALAKKGEAVDVLVMTATPIPRTLVLTYFGDMDVSELREKPAGRQPSDTRVLPQSRLDEEVGVDVPEATVMVIEHAERFGLAQLHQLRGRIGRGSEHSSCLLLYRGPLGETAKARLNIMRETEDGFRIAEEDLRLRGEGDVL